MSFTVFYKKGRGEEIVQEGATREEAEQLIARLFRDEFRFVKARCENSGVLIDHSFVLPDMDELTSDCSLCLRFHGKDVDDMQWFDLDSYLSTEIEDAWVELCEDKDMDDDNPQYIIVGVGPIWTRLHPTCSERIVPSLALLSWTNSVSAWTILMVANWWMRLSHTYPSRAYLIQLILRATSRTIIMANGTVMKISLWTMQSLCVSWMTQNGLTLILIGNRPRGI